MSGDRLKPSKPRQPRSEWKLDIRPYEFEYKTGSFEEPTKVKGFKVVIDEKKGDIIPKTLSEFSEYLPKDITCYHIRKQKGSGVNVGYFAAIHIEIIDRHGKSEMREIGVLIKKSKPAQDIAEFIAGGIQNDLIGDLAAPIHLLKDNEETVWVISLLYPGFEDVWKTCYDNINQYRILHNKKTIPVPDKRPKAIGSINKNVQSGLFNVKDRKHPDTLPAIYGFHINFSLAFINRNYDIHLANQGICYIFTNSTPIQFLQDHQKVMNLIKLRALCRKALADNNSDEYKSKLYAYNEYKKLLGVTETAVLIDHGWAHHNWKSFVDKFKETGDTGFDITLAVPMEPTNHFSEISRNIIFIEEFASAMEYLRHNILTKKDKIMQQLKRRIDLVEKRYGKEGLLEYAIYMGLRQGTDFTEETVKEKIVSFVMEALSTEALVAEKLAFETRLSLCFRQVGVWEQGEDGMVWKGKKGEFNFDEEAFKELILVYGHSDSFDPTFENVTFRGPGQKKFQTILRKQAKQYFEEFSHSQEYLKITLSPRRDLKIDISDKKKSSIYSPSLFGESSSGFPASSPSSVSLASPKSLFDESSELLSPASSSSIPVRGASGLPTPPPRRDNPRSLISSPSSVLSPQPPPRREDSQRSLSSSASSLPSPQSPEDGSITPVGGSSRVPPPPPRRGEDSQRSSSSSPSPITSPKPPAHGLVISRGSSAAVPPPPPRREDSQRSSSSSPSIASPKPLTHGSGISIGGSAILPPPPPRRENPEVSSDSSSASVASPKSPPPRPPGRGVVSKPSQEVSQTPAPENKDKTSEEVDKLKIPKGVGKSPYSAS